MSLTVADFTQLVRARLREANNSKLGEMQTGVGGAATVSAADRIKEIGERVAEQICRTCAYVYLKATTDPDVPIAAETNLVDLASLDYEAGKRATIWRPESVWWNGFPLREIERGLLREDTRLGQPGVPTRFYRVGEGVIGLDPRPAEAAHLAVAGASVPPAPSGGTPSWSFLPDETLVALMVPGAAYMLSLPYADDPAILERGAAWLQEYNAERMRRWAMLDDIVKAKCFPTPPIPMQQIGRKR
jgi:hypothetical protein